MRKKLYLSEYIYGYTFVLPALIMMGIWFYYPVISGFMYSFMDIDFLQMDMSSFVGLSNYRKVLTDPDFILSLRVSVTLTLVAVPIEVLLSLLIAYSLNSLNRLKSFYRTLYFIPYVTSTIAVTIVFMYLFVRGSFLVSIASRLFGLPNDSWFANVYLAVPFLIILYIWKNLGFYTVIYLSGLQTIPGELYEAATIDGANSYKRLRYITIPMLKPTTFLVLLHGVISAMQVFDECFAVARGGALGSPAGRTSTLMIYFYNEAFMYRRIGYGSAAALIIFFILLTVSLIQKKIMERE